MVPVFASGNIKCYSDLARFFATILSHATLSAEGHPYVHLVTILTLGLTRCKFHAVLFTRPEQPYHPLNTLPTSSLLRPPPLPSTQRYSSTSAFIGLARASLDYLSIVRALRTPWRGRASRATYSSCCGS
jgi:hypothetical protein